MKGNKIFIVLIIALVSATTVRAHDTTHIHPMITERAADLIATKDVDNKYEEIYKTEDQVRLYWGRDFDKGKSFPDNYLLVNQLQDYTDPTNVINGVVHEDDPATKVRTHFYHGGSGRGLTLNGLSLTPSANKSMEYFDEAIDFYGGYTEEAKKHAYFVFGQSLHHVEDMSSPAHVHNDVHLTLFEDPLLTIFDPEKDDFEGWYLVFEKQRDANLSDFFNGADEITRVDNPWIDIWDTSYFSGSLVGGTYNRTIYQGNLTFPRTVAVDLNPVDAGPRVTLETVPGGPFVILNDADPGTASGELAEMFPCEISPGVRDETVDNCLHWEEDDIFELAHWTINIVGPFQHQYSTGYGNDWWPVEFATNPDGVIDGQVSVGDQYYIESLYRKSLLGFRPDADPVVPTNVRSNALPGSPTSSNSKSLLEIRAQALLPSAVEFSAGFTQYWFDVANTPPYLKAVTVSQAPKDAAQSVEVYEVEWKVLDDDYSETESIRKEEVRSLIPLTEKPNYIHADKPVTFKLEFNEPIESIEFIGLGSFNNAGQCVSSNGCLEFTPAPNDWTVDEELVFTYELAGSQLQGLDGKYSLTVKAIDKNNHRDGMGGTDGAHLDATPGSPARRNLFKVAADPTSNEYPWHQRGLTTEDEDEEDANEKYSYDFEGGDVNHSLLIDTSPPAATIDIIDTLTQPN